jgi:hypothetical protein
VEQSEVIKDCPEPESLLKTALRESTGPSDAAILRHVEACDVCRQRVREIRALAAVFHSIPLSPPSRDCLDADAIAAVVEGSASDIDDNAMLHVAQCSNCRMRVAAAAQLLEDTTVRSELDALQSPRRAIRPAWSRRNLTVSGLIAAAAAVIVLLGPMVSDVRRDRSGTSTEPQRERAAASVLRVLSPTHIADLSDSLRWTSVPQADLYRVRIWNSEGSVVWTKETRATTVPLPQVLESGVPYLWEVSARTGWDRWISSDLVELTLPARRPP